MTLPNLTAMTADGTEPLFVAMPEAGTIPASPVPETVEEITAKFTPAPPVLIEAPHRDGVLSLQVRYWGSGVTSAAIIETIMRAINNRVPKCVVMRGQWTDLVPTPTIKDSLTVQPEPPALTENSVPFEQVIEPATEGEV